MSRTLFENSKAALAFAGMTILGAVVMVGSDDGGGVLDQTVDRFAQEREAIAQDARKFAESKSVGDDPGGQPSGRVSDPDAGWGSSTTVFGHYSPGDQRSEVIPVTGPPSRSISSNNPPDMLLRAPPVTAVSKGAQSPRPDGFQSQSKPPPAPVITSREMTIEPH